eukprot:PhM_4_TR13945/c3_g2_i4/m.88144
MRYDEAQETTHHLPPQDHIGILSISLSHLVPLSTNPIQIEDRQAAHIAKLSPLVAAAGDNDLEPMACARFIEPEQRAFVIATFRSVLAPACSSLTHEDRHVHSLLSLSKPRFLVHAASCCCPLDGRTGVGTGNGVGRRILQVGKGSAVVVNPPPAISQRGEGARKFGDCGRVRRVVTPHCDVVEVMTKAGR